MTSSSTWISGKTTVKGTYCSQPIEGIIVEGRPYPAGNRFMLTIALSTPINVYGQIRHQVTVDNDEVEVTA